MTFNAQRWLVIYSGILTLAVAAALLMGAAKPDKVATFDEIDVQRINLRESDGTLRMVLSSMERFPGAIVKGQEHAHPRANAGMLFYNDEGTENGGLVFSGKRKPDGTVEGFVHMSFDQYEQDQVMALNQIEDAGTRTAGLQVWDRPGHSISESMQLSEQERALDQAERERRVQARADEGYYGRQRMFVGKNRDRQSVVELRDEAGNVRLRMKVEPEGAAAIEFLDAAGKVQRSVRPEGVSRG